MKSDIAERKPRGGARRGSGRKPAGLEAAVIRVPVGTLAALDDLLTSGERRADALRTAVDREIARREASRRRPEASK